MGHKIFTRNIYIKNSFKYLLESIRTERNYFVVDVDSYPSFAALLDVLENANPADRQPVIMIKGIGIHSRVLSPLTAFCYDDCLPDIIKCLKGKKNPEWQYIRHHLTEMQDWSMMTSREMNVIRFIVKYPDIVTAARALNSNNKTVYSRVGLIARKLNLRNANEVRRLAMAECI